ncbi:glycosyl hydrolases family 31-domain-containing protein [Aspergillus pseudonomiae]|uniref:alpha-glucosidase n=1 Tax=Aspergillus pseudonomiae TaxID=1506151 RepID=A0A5N7CUT1_9EURO|nr:glycosyl hydrolases family 31-domain-containing protein [Aspergillus pseudonomiae]KAE8397719.1 glycosyl hydrolases family 31-domain-containing protein [Aspergillus pseudonomiae]
MGPSLNWKETLGLLSVCWLMVQAQAQPTPAVSSSFAPQYTLPVSANEAPPVLPNIRDPLAVDAQTVCPGYVASSVQQTPTGLTALLSLAGHGCNVYGTDIDSLNLTVEYQTTDRLHVEIVPTYIGTGNATQYIIPPGVVAKPGVEGSNAESDLEFSWTNEPSFGFEVARRSTKDVLFSTKGKKLVFEDQFIEFTSPLPENYNIYGLGESVHAFRLGNNYTKTFYAADAGATVDINVYGTHPFYLETRYFTQSPSGDLTLVTTNEVEPNKTYTSFSHGVYSRNAHGQDIVLQPDGITWRAIGGSIDLYFFSGPTQPEVTTSYLKAVGLPALQQYWTFGFHQCRWGYKSWDDLEDVVNSHINFGIPLETVWTDIDWMLRYRDFENEPVGFDYEAGNRFLERLHDGGRHYVPIFDSAIYIPNPDVESDAYPTFERGNKTGSFLTNPDGSLYIGSVWPGYTVFPDWLSEGAEQWWIDEMILYHQKTAYDGAWVDMSEISSFCVGSCGSGNLHLNPVHHPFALPGETRNPVLKYPEGFNVTNSTEAAAASSALASFSSAYPAPTSASTVSYVRTTPTPGVRDVNYPPYAINNVKGPLGVAAISPNATHAEGTLEYDMHNLWGHGIIKATYAALSEIFPGHRPFIIARSTFSGSGAFAGHWGGDNWSNWPSMAFSIPQALQMSLLGVPMFGSDTCGFADNTDMELCNRWMQLSAFFPFYRNHNILGAISQEAYTWASFPNDPSLAGADRQFLLGPSILVIPVLEPGATSVNGVLPGLIEGSEKWYDWYNQTAVPVPSQANTTFNAPLGHIPVFVRGGSVLPLQQPALTTRDARQSPWDVLVALDRDGKATGDLYLDDGVSVQPDATLTAEFTVGGRKLEAAIGQGGWVDGNSLRNITILGVESVAGAVKFNGRPVHRRNVHFDKAKQTLVVSGFDVSAWAGERWTLEW